jgi:membrane-associated protease RseP (regulator of RpoE activity)
VTLTVLRDGESQDIEIDLSELNLQAPLGLGMGSVMMGQPTQLGVQFLTLTPDIAQEKGLSVEQGALVEQVFDNTPAASAGLQQGDIITAVDGDQVDEEHTLVDRLYAYEEGDQVTLTVMRGRETQEITVTLGARSIFGGMMMPGMGRGGMPFEYFFGPGMRGGDQFGDRHGFYFFGPGGMFQFGPDQSAPERQTNPAAPDAPAA